MNPMIATAHLVDRLLNINTPRWARAAAITKDGIRKAAIAEAATLG